MSLPIELVTAVLESVRPGDQQLASARGAHLADLIAVDEVVPPGRIRPQASAHLDDDGMLFPERELDLLARRRDQWAALLPVVASVSAPIRSSTWSPTLSEFAIAVSAGLTAPMLGKTLVSTT
jgi:hypothetical protein